MYGLKIFNKFIGYFPLKIASSNQVLCISSYILAANVSSSLLVWGITSVLFKTIPTFLWP